MLRDAQRNGTFEAGVLTPFSRPPKHGGEVRYESADEFIARKSAEWQRDLELGRLIRMKDVGREAVHFYQREAWTFLAQDTYAEAVNVLERLTHLRTVGTPAVAMTLPAVEYRIGYWIVGRMGIKAGVWTWGQSAPIMSDGDLERIIGKARAEGTLIDHAASTLV